MAITITDLSNPAAAKIFTDTDSDATSENDANSGAATVFVVDIDNTANTSAASYTKLYNAAAPTVGTTDPDIVLLAPSSTRISYVLGSPGQGTNLGTALSFATVTTGGTSGTTSPTNDVAVRIFAT